VIRLQPYFENFGKRVVKSSKIYFADMGLACYLLGIESLEQLSRDPLRGQLTENLALLEFVKARYAQALDPQLYFFRDAHGHEVDFIFQRGRTLVPIEVKSAKTFHAEYLKGIRFFQELVGDRAPQGYLIYGGSLEERLGASTLLPFEKAHQVVTGS
jgi:predicted AAA+ superfamily ATPase